MNELLTKVIEFAHEAGDIMRSAHDDRRPEEIKAGHRNFVTIYDKRIQEFLIENLAHVLPEANFVGEEDGHEISRRSIRKVIPSLLILLMELQIL